MSREHLELGQDKEGRQNATKVKCKIDMGCSQHLYTTVELWELSLLPEGKTRTT